MKVLRNSAHPLTFTALLKQSVGGKTNSSRFSYHLNKLQNWGLVESQAKEYSLTTLGHRLIEKYRELEQILETGGRKIMVRTSKYVFEEFDPNKIQEHLEQEAGLDHFLAQKIAQEAEERLQGAKIKYLTAPLIREYVNAILVENELEEFRHLLTRLGLPGHDVTALLAENAPEEAWRVRDGGGHAILEQYILLNVFPKDIADLYLGGTLGIPLLGRWLTAPYVSHCDLAQFVDATGNLRVPDFLGMLNSVVVSSPGQFNITYSPLERDSSVVSPLLSTCDILAGYSKLFLARGFTPQIVAPITCVNDLSLRNHTMRWDVFCWLLVEDEPSWLDGFQRLTTNFDVNQMVFYRPPGDPPRLGALFGQVSDHYVLNVLNLFLRVNQDQDQFIETLTAKLTAIGDLAGRKKARGLVPVPIRLSLMGLPELAFLTEGFFLDETQRSNAFAFNIMREVREAKQRIEGEGTTPILMTQNLTDLPLAFLQGAMKKDRIQFHALLETTPRLKSILDLPQYSVKLFRPQVCGDLKKYPTIAGPFQELLDEPLLLSFPIAQEEKGKALTWLDQLSRGPVDYFRLKFDSTNERK